MNTWVHMGLAVLVYMSVLILAGLRLAPHTLPLLIVVWFGAVWLVGDVVDRMHTWHLRRLVARAADALPRGGDTIDVRGKSDDEIRALMIAYTMRTGRTQHAVIDHTRGLLRMHDVGPGITIDDVD